jgi:hypothetical protein
MQVCGSWWDVAEFSVATHKNRHMQPPGLHHAMLLPTLLVPCRGGAAGSLPHTIAPGSTCYCCNRASEKESHTLSQHVVPGTTSCHGSSSIPHK